MLRLTFALLFCLFALLATAKESSTKQPSRKQESAALRAAELAGARIYRLDQAAAAATDAVLANSKFKRDKRMRGWITEEQSDQVVVSFIDKTPAVLYRVSVSNGVAGPVSAMETPAPLSPYEAGAAAARALAVASDFQPCSKTYNSVVHPSEPGSDSRWTVYMLPGTTKHDLIPMGGTYRINISGSKILAQRAFTRSCIDIQSAPNAEFLMITHLLDPIPTEAHVFWNLLAKKPLLVGTTENKKLWMISNGEIKFVRNLK